jgi:hypothetical protein
MSVFTLTEIEEQIAEYKLALKACAGGQSVRMSTPGGSDRTWTSADLPEIRRTLDWLGKEKARLLGRRASVTVIGRPAR